MSGSRMHPQRLQPPATGAATPRIDTSDMDSAELPIGRRVAHWRTRRNMSQQMLADRIGMSKSWVDKVERGLRALDKLSVICRIADVLEVNLPLLLGRPDGEAGAAARLRQAPTAKLDLDAAARDVDILMHRHLKPDPARTARDDTRLLRAVLTVAYAAMATEGVPAHTCCRVIATVFHHRGARL